MKIRVAVCGDTRLDGGFRLANVADDVLDILRIERRLVDERLYALEERLAETGVPGDESRLDKRLTIRQRSPRLVVTLVTVELTG